MPLLYWYVKCEQPCVVAYYVSFLQGPGLSCLIAFVTVGCLEYVSKNHYSGVRRACLIWDELHARCLVYSRWSSEWLHFCACPFLPLERADFWRVSTRCKNTFCCHHCNDVLFCFVPQIVNCSSKVLHVNVECLYGTDLSWWSCIWISICLAGIRTSHVRIGRCLPWVTLQKPLSVFPSYGVSEGISEFVCERFFYFYFIVFYFFAFFIFITVFLHISSDGELDLLCKLIRSTSHPHPPFYLFFFFMSSSLITSSLCLLCKVII